MSLCSVKGTAPFTNSFGGLPPGDVFDPRPLGSILKQYTLSVLMCTQHTFVGKNARGNIVNLLDSEVPKPDGELPNMSISLQPQSAGPNSLSPSNSTYTNCSSGALLEPSIHDFSFKAPSPDRTNGRLDESSASNSGTIKRFQCEWKGCDKAFAMRSHLERHMRTHYDVRPFKCPIENCSSNFNRHDNMIQHYRYGTLLLL